MRNDGQTQVYESGDYVGFHVDEFETRLPEDLSIEEEIDEN